MSTALVESVRCDQEISMSHEPGSPGLFCIFLCQLLSNASLATSCQQTRKDQGRNLYLQFYIQNEMKARSESKLHILVRFPGPLPTNPDVS